MINIRRAAPVVMGGVMTAIGSAHFLIPKQMEATIPPFVPGKREVLYASGVIEVACGLGLLARKPLAARVAALTLLAIWPANLQMALDSGSGKLPPKIDNKAVLWARAPLQLPMIWAVLQGDGRVR